METVKKVTTEEHPISRKLLNHILELGNNNKIIETISEIKLDEDENTSNLEENVTLEHQAAQIKAIEPKSDKTREEEFDESVQGNQGENLRQNSSGRQPKSINDPTSGTSKNKEVPLSREPITSSVGETTGITRVNKPSTLNLTDSSGDQAIESPQPSAALKSLKSARWLTSLDPSIYPPSIKSPDPCLNHDIEGSPGYFKYDKEFLLQFEKYFIEKPCLDFETQVKALIELNRNLTVRYGTTRISDNIPRKDISNTRTNQFDRSSFKFGSIQKPTISSRWDSFGAKTNEPSYPLGSAQEPSNISWQNTKNIRKNEHRKEFFIPEPTQQPNYVSNQDTNNTKFNESERGFFIPKPSQQPDYVFNQDTSHTTYNEFERGLVQFDSTHTQDDMAKQSTKKIKNDNKKFGLSGFSWGDNRRPVDNITKEEFESITRQWREFKS
ncbi:hypothetical protein EPUL_004423 [Erysiphe pulchra]|uniref:Eukaryotic translation initiation factor 4G1 eIF4E-binding domain-containing protein n=1 Tax=Erysiphe pulchra TaxID=225359 RepID=A0A2S4PM66_9PEZI|nr:hypothetical protein EPUL_004423 [Erysiphe pulchra]